MSVGHQGYASSAAVRRAINAVSKAGIVVGGVKLNPDRSIELHSSPQTHPAPDNDFDRLEAAGAL